MRKATRLSHIELGLSMKKIFCRSVNTVYLFHSLTLNTTLFPLHHIDRGKISPELFSNREKEALHLQHFSELPFTKLLKIKILLRGGIRAKVHII